MNIATDFEPVTIVDEIPEHPGFRIDYSEFEPESNETPMAECDPA